MSDRLCIASGGQIQVSLSADDLLSCCKDCGFGCMGGQPLEAWRFWEKEGIVTGSNYTMQQGFNVKLLSQGNLEQKCVLF
jgi:cathepsin B